MATSDSQYRLNFSRRRLGDFDLRQLSEIRQGTLPYEEVDFSQNELSSGGLKAVLEVCKRCPKLRVLKLFKNRIDDSGAEGLAELCRLVPGIEEIHLSHNHFTAVGVEILVSAAEQARKPNALPLWLRLEQNDVAEPDATFEHLQKTLSVCKRVDEVSCTVRVCCRKHKVHLPFFHLQRTPRFGTFRREEAAAPNQPVPMRPVATAPSRSPTSNGCSWNSPTSGGDARGGHDEGSAALRQGGGTAWGSPLMAPPSATPATVRRKEDMETTSYIAQKWAADESQNRVSLVLDRNGQRRILPEQLEAEESDFVCHLCSFVMVRPVITRCSHLFCDPCFRNWVSDQVVKHKQGPAANEPVPLIPCPICKAKLRKTDIAPMSVAEAPAAILLQRRRNNLQIRCVHHPDHFKFAFGKDAERMTRDMGVRCSWTGDQPGYEDHLRKCEVERRLQDAQNRANGGTASIRVDGSDQQRNHGLKVSEPAAEPEPIPVSSEQEEVRVARFEYNSSDQAQLKLMINDLVKVFKVTSTGWAAGVRLSPTSMQEQGEPGWFPVGYLHPSDYRPLD